MYFILCSVQHDVHSPSTFIQWHSEFSFWMKMTVTLLTHLCHHPPLFIHCAHRTLKIVICTPVPHQHRLPFCQSSSFCRIGPARLGTYFWNTIRVEEAYQMHNWCKRIDVKWVYIWWLKEEVWKKKEALEEKERRGKKPEKEEKEEALKLAKVQKQESRLAFWFDVSTDWS